MIQSPTGGPSGLAGDVAVAGAKVTPPIAASAAIVLGQALEPWVVILTVVFLGLQILHIGNRLLRDFGNRKSDG
jgi:ABC-type taurine transport system ATPase subunit